jgi:peptidoglycan-associated lipoprotein
MYHPFNALGRPSVRLCTLLFAAALALSGCKPTDPKCDGDDACLAKGEVCLMGQCQECRDDAQCASKYPDAKRVCHEGRCEARPECHVDTDCVAMGPNLVCKHSSCVPQCSSDSECGAGQHCINQKCLAQMACGADSECAAGQACLAGVCQAAEAAGAALGECKPLAPGDVVNLDMVHFEFNKYDLSADAKEQLNRVMECLKQAPAGLKVVVEGHCDDRGTQEYNLALGEKRAHAVYVYFKQMGLEARRFTVRSKGENEPLCTDNDEACFLRNRRVQFIQQHR